MQHYAFTPEVILYFLLHYICLLQSLYRSLLSFLVKTTEGQCFPLWVVMEFSTSIQCCSNNCKQSSASISKYFPSVVLLLLLKVKKRIWILLPLVNSNLSCEEVRTCLLTLNDKALKLGLTKIQVQHTQGVRFTTNRQATGQRWTWCWTEDSLNRIKIKDHLTVTTVFHSSSRVSLS